MNQLVKIDHGEILAPPSDPPCHLGRVLVVHKEMATRDLIKASLEDDRCIAVGSAGDDLRHQLQRHQLSLVILNLEAEPFGRFDTLRHIRSLSDVPVILISGKAENAIDRIVGLELGADDLIASPFHPRELIARARAILRRQELGRELTASRPHRGYRFLGWEMGRRGRNLTDPAGRPVELTKGEYGLLVAFLDAPRRPLTREQLMQATGAHEDIYDRSVDVRVLRLRRRLEAQPSAPRLIRTLRGLGYLFDCPVETLF